MEDGGGGGWGHRWGSQNRGHGAQSEGGTVRWAQSEQEAWGTIRTKGTVRTGKTVRWGHSQNKGHEAQSEQGA